MGLKELLLSLKRPVLVTFHYSGDVDALSSAYVVAEITGGRIWAPDDPEAEAKRFAEALGIHYSLERPLAESVVLVDTHSPSQTPLKRADLVIDHHPLREKPVEGRLVHDPEAGATAEILARNLSVKGNLAFALACGILSDTARFRRGSPRTLEAFLKVLRASGKSYEEVLRSAFPEPPAEEKVFALRKLAEVEIFEGKRVVALVKSEEKLGHLACLLTELGADYGIAYGGRRISLRRGTWSTEDLGKLAREFAVRNQGSGGGHEGSAGLRVEEAERVAREIAERLAYGSETGKLRRSRKE